MNLSRKSTCSALLAANWRTTIAPQNTRSARKTTGDLWRRRNCMRLLLRQDNDFGNSIESRQIYPGKAQTCVGVPLLAIVIFSLWHPLGELTHSHLSRWVTGNRSM